MRDFDVDRRKRHADREEELGDRSFVLNGETFTYKANVPYGVIHRITTLTETTDGSVVIDTLVDTILAVMEEDGGAHERFRAVCENDEFPLTFEDLIELSGWLIQEQTGRPTVAPSPSQPGRETNGTTSTATASSTPAAA